MQLSDRVCQKHRPLVFLAVLLLVKEYATYNSIYLEILSIYIIFLLSKHASLCNVKEQLFNYIVLCFIKLQILARISSFSLLRSQYNRLVHPVIEQ
jgi:hypothetical protein